MVAITEFREVGFATFVPVVKGSIGKTCHLVGFRFLSLILEFTVLKLIGYMVDCSIIFLDWCHLCTVGA